MKDLNIWQKILYSFDNITKNALSARKLTAFIIIVCVVVGHGFYFKHCFSKEDFSLYDTILIIDYIAAAFFLGLVTVANIIELKNGQKKDVEKEPSNENI